MKFIACVFALALLVSGCGGGGGASSAIPTAPSAGVPFSTIDLRAGTGAEATNGRLVTVHYTGWNWSASGTDNKGSQFDSSLSPGRTPFQFVLGTGNVIQGWHRGVLGMRVGGLRRVIIPPDLAYGAAGRPPEIPGNSTLIFDIELLAIQ